jgi:hypothetical protein
MRERPEGRRLFDMLRAGDALVVRWVDRLGRNYADVTEVIRQFMARGIVIKTVISGLTFDGATKDPMQKAVRDALIAFMAAMAEAQAEATREAQRAGIAHAKANEPRSWPSTGALAVPNGCFQRSHGDAGVHGSTNRVADNLARPGVKDGGEIDEAAGDGDIGQVRNP